MRKNDLLLHVGVGGDGREPGGGLGGRAGALFGGIHGEDVPCEDFERLDEVVRGRLVRPHPVVPSGK